jgi:hypothetical protein
MTALKKFEVVSLIAGLALLVWIIRRTGWDEIVHYLRALGFGAFVVLALSALRNLARAASWHFAIEPAHRNVSFFTLINIMLAGEAIKYLTATGPILGEPAKAAMVRRQIPLLYGASSLAVENMIYYLSVFLFILSVLPVLSMLGVASGVVKIAGYALAGGVIAAILIVYFAVRRRLYPLARALEAVSRLSSERRKEPITRLVAKARALEDNVYNFYSRRRAAFLLILALNLLAHVINIFEVWLILDRMGLEGGLLEGFVIEAGTKVINLAFFFVPARAGVYESGNAVMLDALGLSASAGVALAIIRKLRALIWAAWGVGVIGLLVINDRRSGPD